MEFEQLEAEAHNLTTDNAKLAQVLRASALEEDDEDNLAIDDSETLGTDDEQGDEDGDSEYQDEEEEEETPERQEDIHLHRHQQLHQEQEQYAALHDERAAAAAMQHLGSMQAQYPPPLPTVDYLTLSELQSPLYVEPTYHLVAPSPDVSASTSTTAASAASNPPVDQAEIRRALALNLQYREILKQQLKNIEEARARNAEYQKKIKALIVQSQKKTARKPGKRSFTAPYFATATGEVPPENRDTLKRRDYLKRMPTGFKCKKWNQTEEKALASGVRTMNQGILWARMMERSQTKSSEELQRERDAIKRMPPDQLEMNLEGLDWDVLAKVHVPTRSAMDCKIHWTQVMHPQINKRKFTKEEDQRLLALANEHKGHNWQAIADALGTDRTASQCMQRYQRSLNTNIMRGKWTKQEDKELVEAVRLYGNKNWQQVAHCLKDRTGQQCLHRWQKTLSPDIRRGRWISVEDMMLTLAVKAYGENLSWVKVQTQVPGRTDVQCRERWVNILNPALNIGPWTEEEDEKLRQHVEAFGAGKWSEIAKILHPRTDNQCWRRWKSINVGAELDNYRRIVHKKRKGLVNNFVGREKERSDLTIGDFEVDEEESARPRPSSPSVDAMRTLSPTPITLPQDLLSSVDSSTLSSYGSRSPPTPLSSHRVASSSSSSSSSATASRAVRSESPGIVILPLGGAQGDDGGEEEEGEQEEDDDHSTPARGARGRKRKAATSRKSAAAPKRTTKKKTTTTATTTTTKTKTKTTPAKKTPAKRGRKRKASEADDDDYADADVDAEAASTAATPRKRGRPKKVTAPAMPPPLPTLPVATSQGDEAAATAEGQAGEVEKPADARRRSARTPKKRKTYGDD